MNLQHKRPVTRATALILAMSLLTSGTFAGKDVSLHTINPDANDHYSAGLDDDMLSSEYDQQQKTDDQAIPDLSQEDSAHTTSLSDVLSQLEDQEEQALPEATDDTSQPASPSIDRQALQQLFESIHSLSSDDYTAGSWDALQAMRPTAQAVYDDADASQDKINATVKQLEQVIHDLVDVSALRTLITDALEKQQDDYTSQVWQPFAQAVNNARAVLEKPEATQAQVDQAANTLESALQELLQEDPGPIRDIFPDPIAAQIVADQIGGGDPDYVITENDIATVQGTDWTLIFVDKGISDISGIEHFVNLTSLNLSYNKLTSLPDDFCRLSNLAALWLNNNELTSLPNDINRLSYLQGLYVHYNQLTSLPESFSDLTALNYLELEHNQLTSLPDDLGRLSYLRELWVESNQLTSLPESVSSLSRVYSLRLNDQRPQLPIQVKGDSVIVDNPISVGNTPVSPSDISDNGVYHQQENHLSWNNIPAETEYLTFSFSQVLSIGSTSAAFDGTVTMPIERIEEVDRDALGEMIAQAQSYPQANYTAGSWDHLQTVLATSQDVYDNPDADQAEVDAATEQLQQAIDDLVDISALQHLVIDALEKQQEDYTADSWLPFAQALEDAQNVLENAQATQEQVDQAANALESAMSALVLQRVGRIRDIFPDPIAAKIVADEISDGDLDHVITQDDIDNVQGEAWSTIFRDKGIGDISGIEYFVHLTSLHLDQNELTSLPDNFGNLSNLTLLWLSNNKLNSLPDTFGSLSSLTTLYLFSNQLTSLPDSFINLSNLEYLHLDNNQLLSLPDNFGDFPALTRLWLENNQLTSLPESFNNLSGLTVLWLHDQQPQLPIHMVEDSLTVNNPITVWNMPVPPSSISDNGVYDASTDEITWNDIPYETTHFTFSFNKDLSIGAAHASFNGTVTVPIETSVLGRIADIFPDPIAAQIVADQIAGGNLDHLITRADIDNVQGTAWSSIFQGKGISDISGIQYFVNLTSLDLHGNQLVILPDNFGNLSSLTHLYLHDNQLTKLPDSLGSLSSLTTLTLHAQRPTFPIQLPTSVDTYTMDNPISIGNTPLAPESISNNGVYDDSTHQITWNNIPTETAQFTFSFRTLLSIGNSNASFDGTATVPIQRIVIIGHIRDVFPDPVVAKIVAAQIGNGDLDYVITENDITNTTGSAWEYIFQDQGITDISGIEYFVNLTSLSLANNQLTQLPENIGQMQGLSTLDVRNNQLSSLPKSIENLELLSLIAFGQKITLQQQHSMGSLALENPISIANEPVTPGNISNHGFYDESSNHIRWDNLTPTVTELTFDFSVPTTLLNEFSGTVTVPVEVNLPVNRDALAAMIDRAESYDGEQELHTEASWRNLQDKLERARDVYANPNATQDEVDQATQDLEAAIDSLVVIPIGRIGDVFPDLIAAGIVANQLGEKDGNVDYVITKRDIANTQGTAWRSIFANQGIADITGIGYFVNLTILNLSSNQLGSLPEEIGNLTNLTYLGLYNNQLTSLPDSLGNLTNLTQIGLANNQLISLPDSFGNLTSLRTVYINDNQLTSLPSTFGNLTNLTRVDCNNNQLTSLPDSFGNLTSLVQLYLQNNQLTSLPDSFGKLSNLSYLPLEDNQLSSLPDSFGNLTSVTHLYLQDNQLSSLPDSFGNLTSLVQLYLQNNQLTSLPDSFGNLSKLGYARLSNNQLSSLPDTIQNRPGLSLLADGQQISLSQQQSTGSVVLDNPISAFGTPVPPKSISHSGAYDSQNNRITWNNLPLDTQKVTFEFKQPLSQSGSLEFSGTVTAPVQVIVGRIRDVFPDPIAAQIVANEIGNGNLDHGITQDDIDSVQGAAWLTIFREKGIDDITGIEHFVNLTKLDLSRNDLTSLPDNIGNLKQLTSLHVNRNRLTSLPDSAKSLVNLTTLQLDEQSPWLDVHSGVRSITVDNPISALGTPVPPSSISPTGTYDANSNQIVWNNLHPSTVRLTFEFRQNVNIGFVTGLFSGTVTVPVQIPVGQIREVFPDPAAAQLVAKQIGNGQVEYVITQDDIDKVRGTAWLNLFTNQGITDITGIEYFVNLTELNLNNNKLKALPSDIGNLINLKKLWATHNQLTELPDSIGDLTNLWSLALQFNQLKSLPESLGNLSSLTNLDLYDNQLAELPSSLVNLKSLKELQVYNQKVTLPAVNPVTGVWLLNPIWLFGNPVEPVPGSISHRGTYFSGLNIFIWNWSDIGPLAWRLTFSFSTPVRIGSAEAVFRGTVTIPLNIIPL